ncbi:hypothetical protein A2704_01230 [Candidatus Kaiserbacteria bacterium RIFCSPHIGHO2_01_FULL_54_36b]|uniref:Response regulatory domain-containing protein n=1 Tax=Candidatus Kaiserbacteria bacterium RIFCSPHIGHO2_01_FULL_54_36b TaxID=1798483 RepID=A0A1F6CRN9_9BACT|nr:MAG: hypothetical protein A2704_01230 [Candidatus Kaiserbacteria bacterium RIFCSPHIGHO2_01_FULL_54_36b]
MRQNKKVLLIEDEKILGEILLTKLSDQGYEAKWELDGEAGMTAVREFRPDLILLDIVMPKMDGYEVLEQLGKDAELKKIPVIVISNSGQPVEIERILELGAKDYIVKAQFSPEEVLSKMRKYLTDDAAQGAPAASSSARKNVRILVIEDDAFLSTLATEAISKEGYRVTSAFDGKQAWELMQKETPDLVLLDIIMPDMNGFEVLKKMKADEKFKNILVIIFSNLGQEQEIAEAHNLGADDYLVKANFTLREVTEKIAALLTKHGKL